MGIVKAVCISESRGTPKRAVDSARLIENFGVEGDAHAGDWHRQVSLLSAEQADAFNALGADILPGAFGENLLVAGFDFKAMPVGTVFRCGDVLLEMTQVGKECHSRCQIFDRMGDCIMPREGVFARVLQGGEIRVGDKMAAVHTAAVLTVSDRGFAGERADESGPLAVRMLSGAGYAVIETLVIPDERTRIEAELARLSDERRTALVITTGGTGFSPRDVTPEATLKVADRLAPGIAEAIRAHSMMLTKRAMFSRGAAVLRGGTLIVNLPGSPRAVSEALGYILPELEHGISVLRGETGNCAVK